MTFPFEIVRFLTNPVVLLTNILFVDHYVANSFITNPLIPFPLVPTKILQIRHFNPKWQ